MSITERRSRRVDLNPVLDDMKTQAIESNGGAACGAPITTLQHFCRNMGIAPITAWRMRGKGWLQTVNIAGRPYITAEASAEFVRRATAGEFAKHHPSPTGKASR